jgi:hypothetical protein
MRRLISLLVAGLLAAGCTGSGGAGSSNTPEHYDVGTGSGDLILQVTTGGGLMPIEYSLTHMPDLALYGDGRIIVRGPQIEIYPGPLLPNMRVIRVTPDEIHKIVAAADDAGLLGPDANFNATDIFDGPSTTFITIVGGKTHTIGAYALGIGGTVDDPVVEAARARLLDFDAAIADLSKFLGRSISDEEAYEPAGMRVFAAVADESHDASELERQVVDWPLTMDPATAGQAIDHQDYRCLLLTGADLAVFLTVARTANTLTIWRAPSGRYTVMVRPLYPDESSC